MVIINGYNEQATPTILNFKTYALYTLTNFHKQLKSVISVEFGTPWKNGTTVNSRYSGPLNCGHLDIAATYLGTDLKLHQDCTNLVSDLRSPRYSVLQPLLETPISVNIYCCYGEC